MHPTGFQYTVERTITSHVASPALRAIGIRHLQERSRQTFCSILAARCLSTMETMAPYIKLAAIAEVNAATMLLYMVGGKSVAPIARPIASLATQKAVTIAATRSTAGTTISKRWRPGTRSGYGNQKSSVFGRPPARCRPDIEFPTDDVDPLEQIFLTDLLSFSSSSSSLGLSAWTSSFSARYVTRMSSKNSSFERLESCPFQSMGAPFSIDLIDVTRMVARAQL